MYNSRHPVPVRHRLQRPNCREKECLQPYCVQPDQRPVSSKPLLFCETCKRANVHPEKHLQKLEKRCILRESIPPQHGRQICTCESQTSYTDDDSDGSSNDLHFAIKGAYDHEPQCPVLSLKWRHEGAKFRELRRARRTRTRRSERGRSGVQKASSMVVGSSAQAVTPPIQFGNVHMMLMVGTIIIENGVPG